MVIISSLFVSSSDVEITVDRYNSIVHFENTYTYQILATSSNLDNEFKQAIEKENAGILIGTRPIAPELIKSAISNIFIKYEEFYQGVEMLKDNLEVTWQQNGVINLCDELAL